MMSHYTKTDWEVVEHLFASETGYQTPKVDIERLCFKKESYFICEGKK